MDSVGATVKELLPLPEVTDPAKREESSALPQEPTISHGLAMADHDEKGVAQEAHDHEVMDLGWHESNQRIPDPLVGGLANDDLWILIRRFNKVSQILYFSISSLTSPSKCTVSESMDGRYLATSISTSPTRKNSLPTNSEQPWNAST